MKGRVHVCVGCVGWGGVSGAGEGGRGRWLCSPIAHVPRGGDTEEARQSWCPARHQEGSSSVTMLVVAERVLFSIVATPMASPAPVVIGSRCPSRPVDYRTG